MRKTASIVVLVLLSAGTGFWLGHAHQSRAAAGTGGVTVAGNVLTDRATFSAGNTVLSNAVVSRGSFAVDGDLRMHSLPDGKVALEGNLNVSPN